MIFNGVYDEALWLTLFANKGKREEIADFVKNICLVFGDEINLAVQQYNDYGYSLKERKENSDRIYGEKVADDGHLYWYSIDMTFGCLLLGRDIVKDGLHYSEISLRLEEFALRNYGYSDNFSLMEISEFGYEYKEELIGEDICLVDSDSIDSQLMKTPFGAIMITTIYHKGSVKRYYKKLNVDSIPRDYKLDEMTGKNNLNRLLRVRRRKDK